MENSAIKPVKSAIEAKLSGALRPLRMAVVDQSHLHAGHAGHAGREESHFSIEIVSEAFFGKSRVERHRIVNQILAEELAGPVHAMALTAKSPAEVA
jgi:BolA family transcriptional regulator, general stress-responsive regulator